MLFAFGISILFLLLMVNSIFERNPSNTSWLWYCESLALVAITISLIHFGIHYMF